MPTRSTRAGKAKQTDMSARIGGRTVEPALPIVDTSLPTPSEVSFDASLAKFCKERIELEPTDGIQRRERVLSKMGDLCRDWIRTVCRNRGLSREIVSSAGGQLFTSGSYRLGVHEPGADIDTILVAPNTCTRSDFFGNGAATEEEPNKRDPESLAERLRRHPDVTNFVPVEGAAVPLLQFDMEGVVSEEHPCGNRFIRR